MRQYLRQQPAQSAIHQRSSICLFDIVAGMIYKMHVVHTGRTGRHTSKTGQTPIDMFDCFCIRRTVVFQHIFDQVNPSARAVQFVTQHLIGWARRCAKPAMHTRPQYLVAAFDGREFKLVFGKIRLHQSIRPGLRMFPGSNCARSPCEILASAGGSG